MNKAIFAILFTFLLATAFQLKKPVNEAKNIIDKSVKVRIDTALKKLC